MLKLGVLLVVIGASAYVLPMIGLRDRITALFPPNLQPYVGGGIIAVGAVLCLLGLKKGKKKDDKK
jgi:hypothetical protein